MSTASVSGQHDGHTQRWSHPVRGDVTFRTVFGDDVATGDGARGGDLTAGVATLDPGCWLGRHRHDPAEVYHVLNGVGVFSVDGTEHPLSEGTTAYIPADSEHAVRNTGDGPLRVFYVLAVGSFADVEYRFTDEA
jgi:quercetin dioxygenase-like cupin family protein